MIMSIVLQWSNQTFRVEIKLILKLFNNLQIYISQVAFSSEAGGFRSVQMEPRVGTNCINVDSLIRICYEDLWYKIFGLIWKELWQCEFSIQNLPIQIRCLLILYFNHNEQIIQFTSKGRYPHSIAYSTTPQLHRSDLSP